MVGGVLLLLCSHLTILLIVVIVVHTQCGGAAACLNAVKSASSTTVPTSPPDAPLNRWLAPLTKLAQSLESRTSTFSTAEALPILVEENVKVQVETLSKAGPILSAWANATGAKRKPVWVHGWVYEIENGTLKDLGVSKGPPAPEIL